MLKSAIKISGILAISLFTFASPVWALSKPAVHTANSTFQIEAKDNIQIEQSLPVDAWTNFQQGFNTFLQLDSAMTRQFFSNSGNFNRFKVQENLKQILISLDVPGIDPRKIKVSVSQGMLFVQARSNSDDKLKQNDPNQFYFSYHVTLPDNANTKKISASLYRGILQITIEKTNKLAAMTDIPVKEIA